MTLPGLFFILTPKCHTMAAFLERATDSPQRLRRFSGCILRGWLYTPCFPEFRVRKYFLAMTQLATRARDPENWSTSVLLCWCLQQSHCDRTVYFPLPTLTPATLRMRWGFALEAGLQSRGQNALLTRGRTHFCFPNSTMLLTFSLSGIFQFFRIHTLNNLNAALLVSSCISESRAQITVGS